jgi:hypothetical protein
MYCKRPRSGPGPLCSNADSLNAGESREAGARQPYSLAAEAMNRTLVGPVLSPFLGDQGREDPRSLSASERGLNEQEVIKY